MRRSIGMAAMVLALATGSTALLGGTELAAPGSPGGISGSPAHILISKTDDNCSENSYTIVNNEIVKTAPNCTSSAKGTKGGGGGGGGQPGTSTPGTATNNCSGSSTTVVNEVPTTSSGCTASAKGTGGSSH